MKVCLIVEKHSSSAALNVLPVELLMCLGLQLLPDICAQYHYLH